MITDLFNDAQLFIRYDTGDPARTNDEDRRDIQSFYSLEGRAADIIYATNGSPISAVTVSGSLEVFYDIARYQLIQTGEASYTLKVVCKRENYPEHMLEEKLKGILRNDAYITVEYVNEIPPSENGKYRTIYSTIPKNNEGYT